MKRVAYSILIVTLAACGGGGGDAVVAPTPPAQSPSGFWISQSVGGATDGVCLIASTSEFACIEIDESTGEPSAAMTGTVSVANGNQVSGSGTAYAAPGFVLGDGSTVGSFTITGGTVSERSAIDLTVDGPGGTNTVSGTFDADYDRGSALSQVEGVYMDFLIGGTVSSFSIDASGVIFAQTATGCVANGQVSVIDLQFNEYDVQLTVSNCPGVDGTYNGLGVTTDTVTTDDTFLFAVFTNTLAILADPVK